ncbi:MAG: flavin monoamine oxidase family protein [Calditrichia bacterium]
MNRREFLKLSSILGLSAPFYSLLSSCNKNTLGVGNFSGSVTIIGAGAAGMAAGYLLAQQGIDYQILEASSTHGGRMKRTTNFADFPVPLGAEWLHVETGIFKEIVNKNSTPINVDTTPYDRETEYGLYEGQRVSIEEMGFKKERKFINSTWFDFFDQYIFPSVREKIIYNTVVESIDYSANKVAIQTANKDFSADKVIVTIPLKILQSGSITFSPELPQKKQSAINEATVWDGCKAFIEFSEKFYPAFVGFEIQPEKAGQKLYYDASYGQNSSKHILGLFAVGSGTIPYVQLTDAALIDYILNELDVIFNNQATANYVKHIFQNWNEEPHINGAYLYDHESWSRVRKLGDSVSGKLFFAGEAYTDGGDWASVHAAARSARRAVSKILQS